MQVLEKILKEIEQKIEKAEKIIVKPAHDKLDEVANDTAEAFIEAYKECQDIIRKYMENDGWISVNSYGLPKEEGIYDLTIINGLEEYVSVRWQFLSGTHLSGTQHYVDGVHYWADNYRGDPINEFLSERVIAWRHIPESYRPERVEKVTEHKRLTTKEKYPHGAEGVSKDKLTGKYCRGVFEATACVEKLAEYETAEEEGRLVVLPVGIGDEVYIIEKCSNIPERLDGTLYDSDGGPGTATGYYCPYEENCPFNGDDFTICDDYKEKLAIFKDYVNEIHIRENEVFIFAENTCQYCSFGKTMFLTREEAEKALRDLKEQ